MSAPSVRQGGAAVEALIYPKVIVVARVIDYRDWFSQTEVHERNISV